MHHTAFFNKAWRPAPWTLLPGVAFLLFTSGFTHAGEMPGVKESCFGIHVVDEATGRGVPLVELRTVNDLRYVTDNAGWIAFQEPGLMNREVFWHVNGPGIQREKDGFGFACFRALTLPAVPDPLQSPSYRSESRPPALPRRETWVVAGWRHAAAYTSWSGRGSTRCRKI